MTEKILVAPEKEAQNEHIDASKMYSQGTTVSRWGRLC
jgi:hypothetical protein